MIAMHSLLLRTKNGLNFGLVKISLLDITFIRIGAKLHRQIVVIPMGTYCAPLVADFFICYERDFMMSLYNDMMIHKLILLKLLAQLPDIWTFF